MLTTLKYCNSCGDLNPHPFRLGPKSSDLNSFGQTVNCGCKILRLTRDTIHKLREKREITNLFYIFVGS
jgi:hypothetical protein